MSAAWQEANSRTPATFFALDLDPEIHVATIMVGCEHIEPKLGFERLAATIGPEASLDLSIRWGAYEKIEHQLRHAFQLPDDPDLSQEQLSLRACAGMRLQTHQLAVDVGVAVAKACEHWNKISVIAPRVIEVEILCGDTVLIECRNRRTTPTPVQRRIVEIVGVAETEKAISSGMLAWQLTYAVECLQPKAEVANLSPPLRQFESL